jgi:hypothetical protein
MLLRQRSAEILSGNVLSADGQAVRDWRQRCGIIWRAFGNGGRHLRATRREKNVGLRMAVMLATTDTTALLTGFTALVAGQAQAVWYPPVLCGGILTFSMSWAIPLVILGYSQADMRHLEAAQFRRE